MDIDYLLWLQEIREALGPIVEAFFNFLSSSPLMGLLILLPCIMFWSRDRKSGFWAFLNFISACCINNFIKITACVFRPWIRDPQIIPSAVAQPHATGYSFPSGHTQTVASTAGSLAVIERKKRLWLSVLLVLLWILVAFSRNYLGVHTPQDVLAASLEVIVIMFVNAKFLKWMDQHPEKTGIVCLIGFVIVAAAAVWTVFKPYPSGYVDGVLVVDPLEMQEDAFEAYGLMLGFFAGWYLEYRFIGFSTEGLTTKTAVIRSVIGTVLMLVFRQGLGKVLAFVIDPRFAYMIGGFMVTLSVLYLTPLIFTAIEKKQEKPEESV